MIIFCLEINLKEHKNSERLIHRSRAVKHKGMPNLYNDVSNKFDMFNKRGVHFMHVNINSILPKLEELKQIVNSVNLSIIGISESKLDSSVDDNEIAIPGYDILRKDRNRNGGGVLAYIRNDLSFNIREDLKSSNEIIFFEIFLPHTKPILIGIAYRPPGDSTFF